MKCVITLLAACLLVPVVAPAQETVSGTYVTFDIEQEITELPDGGSLVRGTSNEYSTTNDADSPFSNSKGTCMSHAFRSEAGEIITAAGSCFLQNPDGDSWWYWWRLEKVGTTDCPISCGTWGIFKGTGAFEGVTGGGTFSDVAAYPDQSSAGVWQAKLERE